MKTRRIYILPTRFGLMFLAGTLVMLLVGATYQNNLVNMLSFFMFSLTFVAMVQTHNNLKDIEPDAVTLDSTFAGQEVLASIVLKNPSREPRFGIEAEARGLKLVSRYVNMNPLLPGSFLKLRSAHVAPLRGRHRIKEISASTVYPVGLFFAWIRFETEAEFYVYPELKGNRPLPRASINGTDRNSIHGRGGEDFFGHRRFQAGDSSRHIDWKAHARGRELLVKEFKDQAPDGLVFDWNELEGIETEDRLSQLAVWIEEAKRTHTPFALRLPHVYFPEATGLSHARQCLEALATFKIEEKGVSHATGE